MSRRRFRLNGLALGAATLIAGVALVAAACGGGTSSADKTANTAATKSAATSPVTKVATTLASGATAAPASTTAATSDGGACPYLSDADAATLLPNAGQSKVTVAKNNAGGKETTCQWDIPSVGRLKVAVDEVPDASLEETRASMDRDVMEKINGLGDSGGFSSKGADSFSIQFIKGKTTAGLSVNLTGITEDAVVALAKKIAAKL